MSDTPDIRVTFCPGCGRTVTLIGIGRLLGDFSWVCPYNDATCPVRGMPQTAHQVRGPLEYVVAGLSSGRLG